jgi:hypothetical protein
MIALEGATLIDGAGGAPKTDALILIKDGTIKAVAQVNEIKIPRGAQRISLVGKTIIPGLIDAHAHVERWALPRYLAWGVTSVRDMHSPGDSGYALKKDLDLGAVLGPRMFTAGAGIDGMSATLPGASAVAGEEEARQAVDQRAVAGADFVKVYTKITPDLLRAVVDEATTLRLRVAAHLGKIDALTAARAGVISLEHMAGVVAAAAPDATPYFRANDIFFAGVTMDEVGWGALDSASVTRIARDLAATHVAIVPTLVEHETFANLDDPRLPTRLGMTDVPADPANRVREVAALLQRSGWRAPELRFRRSRTRQNQFIRAFRAAAHGRRQPTRETSRARRLAARGARAARCGGAHSDRRDHCRHAPRRQPARRRLARHGGARQSRRPRRAQPQPSRGRHRYSRHRLGHAARPGARP